MKKLLMFLLAATFATATTVPAMAAYPEKPIRIIVPFAPGGSSSSSARVIATKLTELLGQQVNVENMGGANGAIGASAAARAPADGYTLFFSSAGIMTVNPALYKKLAYSVKDFEPVSLASNFASVMFINKDFPAKDIPGLIAWAKVNPGKLTFGSAGNGSSGHLWGEVLKSRAGIDIRHIPYKGTGPALTDVIGGQLGFVIDAAVIGMQHVKAGNLRAMAVTSTQRVPAAPDVPTFAEQGVSGFETLSWFGIFAPAHTPKGVLATLQQAIARAAASPEVQEQHKTMGMSAASSTPEALAKQVHDETAHWAGVIRDAGIQLD